jgi:hypothetical protein
LSSTSMSSSASKPRHPIQIILDAPARQWQSAFRSVYLNWVRRLCTYSWCSQRGALKKPGGGPVDTCYFYALGPGHSVLFRFAESSAIPTSGSGRVDGSAPEDLSSVAGRIVQPQVVISSSCASLRRMLRGMGVSGMHLLDDWDDHSAGEDFQESWLSVVTYPGTDRRHERPTGPASPENDRNTKTNSDAGLTITRVASSSEVVRSTLPQKMPQLSSPDVHAELTALRRAQVMGKTVGATVSVSTSRFGRGQAKSEYPRKIAMLDRAPPLVLTGWDDCLIFAEAYANTLGLQVMDVVESTTFIDTASGKNTCKGVEVALPNVHCLSVDLPSLYSRSLGPFSHASLGSLAEQKRSREGAVALTGPILPCANRQLVDSTARFLMRSSCVGDGLISRGRASGDTDVSDALASQIPSSQDASFSQFSPPLQQHAIFHLRVDPGIPRASPCAPLVPSGRLTARFGTIGSDGTAVMNARPKGRNFKVEGRNKSKRRSQLLRCGEVVSTVVWESELQHLLSYRVQDAKSCNSGS